MKLYKSPDKHSRLHIVNGGRTLRIALSGYALHISIRQLKRLAIKSLELWMVVIATLALFRLGQVYALNQRGYMAYGGEYMLLLLPMIYYTAKSTILMGNKKKPQNCWHS